jgi:hypothetical protein
VSIGDADFKSVVERFKPSLLTLDFEVVAENYDGAMGFAFARFKAEAMVLQFCFDRGVPSVTFGPEGAGAIQLSDWIRGLHLELPPAQSFDDEVGLMVEHLLDFRRAGTNDPTLVTRLRDAHWDLVKQTLGMDPDMPRLGH